jgi:membrane carboxypeptidase/penicillin-binding protein
LSEKTALSVIDMMRGVVDRGTGSRIRSTFGIRQDVAGKTGTTQNSADGWFILMHPNLVAGSWVGFNDSRVTFRTDYWGQGGNNALLVVGDFFRQAVRTGAIEDRDAPFPPPPDVDERISIFARAWQWVREQVTTLWESIFGVESEEESQQSDTYIARQSSGGVQINLPEDTEAIADSLTRMEREANRLDSLLVRVPEEMAEDTAAVQEPPVDTLAIPPPPDSL